MFNLFRKLFLVKEIMSRSGTVHFQRYRVLSTPWFQIYLHKISQSDNDTDPHDHPFRFTSIILKGSYREFLATSPNWSVKQESIFDFGSIIRRNHTDAHRIELISSCVWSLVFVTKRTGVWGYQTPDGWFDHKTYRALKNQKWN